MSAIKPGRICVKLAGRDAGEKVVVTKVVDNNCVMIKSPKRKKERKCAIKHLEPTDVAVSS
ncbi:MAG: 50S ribosomal protein L14e [Candidatus Micrarchaeota archaeon]